MLKLPSSPMSAGGEACGGRREASATTASLVLVLAVLCAATSLNGSPLFEEFSGGIREMEAECNGALRGFVWVV